MRMETIHRGMAALAAVGALQPAFAGTAPYSGRPMYEKPFIQPYIHDISFEQGDVLLNGRFRIAGGDLSVGVSWEIDPDATPRFSPYPPGPREFPDPANPPSGCVASGGPPPDGEPGPLERRALACDGARWLYAQDGYCPEGLRATGRLWLETGGEPVVELEVVPECHAPVDAVFGDHAVWVATERPVEKYDPVSGAVLEVALDGSGKVVRHLDEQVMTRLALSPDGRSVWAASRSGVHRFDTATRRWTRRYFRFRHAPAGNNVVVYLDDAPLPAGDYELWSVLLALPIVNRRAFEESWHQVPPEIPWYTFGMSPALWPHYRDSLIALAGRPEGETAQRMRANDFSQLLALVLHTPDVDSLAKAEVAKQLIDIALPVETRRTLVYSLLRDSHLRPADFDAALRAAGVDMQALETERAFYDLLQDARLGSSATAFDRLCELVATHAPVRAIAHDIANSDSYRAEPARRCFEPEKPAPRARRARTPASGEPLLIGVEAKCMKYLVPPGMSAEEITRRMREAMVRGEEPDGLVAVPCESDPGEVRHRKPQHETTEHGTR